MGAATVPPSYSPSLVWIGILAALASLFSLFWLAFIALTPNLMYILASLPLWRPYVDLLWWQFALLSLPFASLLLGVVIAVMAGLGLRNQNEQPTIQFYYLIVAMVLLVFNFAIIL